MKCPNCGSTERQQARGAARIEGKHRFKCMKCGHPYQGEHPVQRSHRFVESGRKATLDFRTHEHITSLEQLIKVCEIDTDIWEVDRYECNKWEMGSTNKAKQVVITPLFQVKAWLSKKVDEIDSKKIIQTLVEDARKFAPKYKKINYPKLYSGMLLEIAMPDVHFGRLTWNEESGEDYDIKIAEKIVFQVLNDLLAYSKTFPINKILLPIGNDYFNVNNKDETTVRGTRQQEDTRWQKTFRRGRELATMMIDRCSTLAPVDVLIISGNHDEERMFYLGDALDCWYHGNPNVSIDNSPTTRKYYHFGKNLIGFTHGVYEKLSSLPLIMALEAKEWWSESSNFEWHLGDKHHKKDVRIASDEGNGMMIRVLRSLAAADAWTFNHGFVGSSRAAEAFLWDETQGVIAQFTAYPK